MPAPIYTAFKPRMLDCGAFPSLAAAGGLTFEATVKVQAPPREREGDVTQTLLGVQLPPATAGESSAALGLDKHAFKFGITGGVPVFKLTYGPAAGFEWNEQVVKPTDDTSNYGKFIHVAFTIDTATREVAVYLNGAIAANIPRGGESSPRGPPPWLSSNENNVVCSRPS